jgi:hypothetical protein
MKHGASFDGKANEPFSKRRGRERQALQQRSRLRQAVGFTDSHLVEEPTE